MRTRAVGALMGACLGLCGGLFLGGAAGWEYLDWRQRQPHVVLSAFAGIWIIEGAVLGALVGSVGLALCVLVWPGRRTGAREVQFGEQE